MRRPPTPARSSWTPAAASPGDTNTIRTGLCSSVDLLNMFVTLGNKGDTTSANARTL